MAAWLKSYIYCSAFGTFRKIFKCISFSVEVTIFFMVALANYFIIFYYNRTYQRIGIYCSLTIFSKFYGTAHIIVICHNITIKSPRVTKPGDFLYI